MLAVAMSTRLTSLLELLAVLLGDIQERTGCDSGREKVTDDRQWAKAHAHTHAHMHAHIRTHARTHAHTCALFNYPQKEINS